MITDSNQKLQIEEAKKCLLAFKERLTEIELAKDNGINIFGAVGMQTQEIKHSAFLAWLLNPNQLHGLNGLFLQKVIEKLFIIKVDEALKANSEILAESKIKSAEDLSHFYNDSELIVETEKVINGADSRIDIFIESKKTKTVLVIENKVFTTTHDNQLKRYEEKLSDRIDWKKIFVYLTPNGDIPTDGGKYNEKWCIFSYKAILNAITELLRSSTLKTNKNLKLKFLLEDYIDMVDTNILKGNKELRSLCRQIRREHKEAFDLLLAYTDNVDEVFKYCTEWAKNNISGLHIVVDNKRSFEFYTDGMEMFFFKNNEKINIDDKRIKCRCGFGYSETVACGISLIKDGVSEWSNAQLKIKNLLERDKIIDGANLSLKQFSVLLMPAKDRELDFDVIKPELDERLADFAGKLQGFDNILKTL